jgi:polysaccharide export outer membrane protein
LIAKKLDVDVLVNPQVTLSVVGYTEHYFTILGQVGSPKVYPLPHDQTLTLLQAVGTAGGYTIYANDKSVKITRTYGGKRTTFKVNARDIANSKASDPCVIRPGDVINVPMSLF